MKETTAKSKSTSQHDAQALFKNL